jgi:exopolyphosphatase/guanosine-5'-triphosphate,3'-diphosphate pyrophosphatase
VRTRAFLLYFERIKPMAIFRAVMDIGTHSCRLIIAEIKDGKDVTHLRQVRVTRIGEGLGQENFHISRIAKDRTLSALVEYKAMIGAYPVEKIWLLGTQALREAENGKEFVVEVKEKTGFDLEIISGRREAYLSYVGAVSGLQGTGLQMPLVLDIGAGSTELFWEGVTVDGETCVDGASAPIGALRLLENPLNEEEILEALKAGWRHVTIPTGVLHQVQHQAEAQQQMDVQYQAEAQHQAGCERSLVAVGGTATTLGAIYMKMKIYDPEALLGLRVSRAEVEEVLTILVELSTPERLALPGMLPGREDVMPWGLRILLGVMTYSGRDEVAICDRDLLYGVLYE